MGLGQRWQATENPFARTRKWVKGDGEWPSIMIDRLEATTRNPQGVRCGRPRPLARESVLLVKGSAGFGSGLSRVRVILYLFFGPTPPQKKSVLMYCIMWSDLSAGRSVPYMRVWYVYLLARSTCCFLSYQFNRNFASL